MIHQIYCDEHGYTLHVTRDQQGNVVDAMVESAQTYPEPVPVLDVAGYIASSGFQLVPTVEDFTF